MSLEELKKLIENLKKLKRQYEYAKSICDPVDFAQRQKNLLYQVCDFLIRPLDEMEEIERQKIGEGD